MNFTVAPDTGCPLFRSVIHASAPLAHVFSVTFSVVRAMSCRCRVPFAVRQLRGLAVHEQVVEAGRDRLAVLALQRGGHDADCVAGRRGADVPLAEQIGTLRLVVAPALPRFAPGQRRELVIRHAPEAEGEISDVAIGDRRHCRGVGVVRADRAAVRELDERIVLTRGEPHDVVSPQQVAVGIGDLPGEGHGVGRVGQLLEIDIERAIPIAVVGENLRRSGQDRHRAADEAGRVQRAGKFVTDAAARRRTGVAVARRRAEDLRRVDGGEFLAARHAQRSLTVRWLGRLGDAGVVARAEIERARRLEAHRRAVGVPTEDARQRLRSGCGSPASAA